MTTPTITVEVTDTIEFTVRRLATLGWHVLNDQQRAELMILLGDMVKARCIQRFADDRQISLQLPTP